MLGRVPLLARAHDQLSALFCFAPCQQPEKGAAKMAVIEFQEVADRRGFIDADSAERGYIRKFRALCDTKEDDAKVILEFDQCPKVGDPYPNDPAATVHRVEATQPEEQLFTF